MVLSVAEYLYVVIIFTFFLANQKFIVLNFMKFFYKLFMVIVHWLDLKMIFLKWVFFNLRIWLIFKETHWRDLHHFHSVLIDFMTTSEKKTLDGSLDLEIQNPKLQTTYQANIQYRPKFSMIKLWKGSNFWKGYHFKSTELGPIKTKKLISSRTKRCVDPWPWIPDPTLKIVLTHNLVKHDINKFISELIHYCQ